MSVTRSVLFASSLSLVLMGCPPKVPNVCDDGACKNDGGGGCFEDSDCPDPRFFFCNTTTSQCEPSCRTKEDCSASARGMYALDYCASGLGCQCDEGKCVGSLCASDSDCGSQVCRSGKCVDAPAASTVASCVVIPDYAVLKSGASQKFSVEAFDSSDKPVVLKSGVTWTAGNGGSITGTGNEATYTAASAAAAEGDGAIATIGTTTCKSKVAVIDGNVTGNDLKVVVTDELTGRGIPGAMVMACDNNGAMVGTSMGPTDATGYTKLTNVTGEVNVTVLSASYNYLTIANYDTAATASRVLSMVLRRNQTDKYGGYKGTFNNVPATSNVHAGIAGMSIADAITDLNFTQLLGNTVPTDVKIGSAVDQKGVPLPAGVYLGFSTEMIKTAISAQGLAGVCGSGKGGETAIAAGTCGTRSAWGLSGDVPLGDLPIDAFANGIDNIMFDVVLGRVLPIFRKFNSAIVRDVEFSLRDSPKDPMGTPEFKDAGVDQFTDQSLEFSPPGAVPLAFNFVNRVPSLPKYRGSYVDGVVMLGGTSVPGRGTIPLGIGVAVNSDGDALTDKQADLSAQGLVTLRMAPTHDGVEGTQYGVLALGLSFKSFRDASAGAATSAVFGHPTDNKLVFDPTGATPLALPGPFPVLPEGAKYNFQATAAGGLPGRTFKIPNFDTSTTTNPMTVVRVSFTDSFDHRWVILADPAKIANTGFTLPMAAMLPPGMPDRTLADGMTLNGGRSGMLVQTVRLSENPTTATPTLMPYKQLVEANSTNADRITDLTTGFSFIDYSKPSVAWTTPTQGGTIAHGANATVTVKLFSVGSTADGLVKVTFTGGTNCPDAYGTTDSSMGKGTINVTVPSTCMGTNMTLTASLTDVNMQALVPPVSASITGVTVN